jgi:hypothetical protein
MFRRNLLPPSSQWTIEELEYFIENACGLGTPHSSTLKMEALCSIETSINIYQTIRRYIAGDSSVCSNTHLRKNLKTSHIKKYFK